MLIMPKSISSRMSRPDDKLAGFIRLSLPSKDAPQTQLNDLDGAALIREVHVYGQSLPVGEEKIGAAQHAGLGTKLLQHAEKIAKENGFKRMAVISAVGTREYYLERGFERGELYLVKDIHVICSIQRNRIRPRRADRYGFPAPGR